MGRGKHFTHGRRLRDEIEALVYRDGWAASLAFSLGLQGALRIDRRTFHVRGVTLPEPLRIGFASDLHAGPLTDPRLFESMTEAFAGFSPHLVLLGGDYVSLHERHLDVLCDALRRLHPPLGILGVVGNHDLWLDDRAIVSTLEEAGVRILVNQNHRLAEPFQNVVVFGLDEPGTGEPDASLASANGSGEVRLVLMHSPLGLRYLAGHPFHVAFCGHTHGGQVALPGGRAIVLPPGSGQRRYARGGFVLPESNAELLVSRGVGMSDIPVRLFAHPEVHLCTVQAGESPA